MAEIQYEVLTDFEMEEISLNEWCLKRFIGFDPQSPNVEIPSEIEGKRIVTLGNELFKNNHLIHNIKISDGIQKIGDRAFHSCKNLKNIVLPNSLVEIGEETFYQCYSLVELNMPNSIISIGKGLCYKCDKLKDVQLSENITVIPEMAFKGCGCLSIINFSQNITEIHNHAFTYTDLKSLNLTKNITVIGDFAFEGIKIKALVIPKSLKKFGQGAFKNCQHLKKIIIEEGCEAEISDDVFSKSVRFYFRKKEALVADDWEKYDTYDNLHKNELARIGQIECFIPSSITNIGKCFSLYDSDKLAYENYENILIYCFKGSYAMAWARERGLKCADYQSNLTTNPIPAPVTLSTNNTEKPTLQDVDVSQDDLNNHNSPDKLESENNDITPEAIETTDIPTDTDANTDVSVTETEETAQTNQTDSETFFEAEKILNDCGYIYEKNDDETYTIKGCNKEITEALIPNGVSVIRKSAFSNCAKLTKVVIPDSVRTVDYSAFDHCSHLHSVVIGKNVKFDFFHFFDTFHACHHLSEVYDLSYAKVAQRVGGIICHTSLEEESCLYTDESGYVFAKKDDTWHLIDYMGTNVILTLPNSCQGESYVLGCAFSGNKTIKEINVPRGVTEIAPFAFSDCKSLNKLVIASSVKKIGREAVLRCEHLVVVRFEGVYGWIAKSEKKIEYIPDKKLRDFRKATELLTKKFTGEWNKKI